MLDLEIFGAKLREHRKKLGLTQEEVADRVGVSAQAVSKWESGECLPDCFNLKSLGEIYGVSLDILLDTDKSGDIDAVAAKIEQTADEFIWAKNSRDMNAHRDLGGDLLKMWKGIYFTEVGDHEKQRADFAAGNLRVCSDFGLKVWDDDGVVCVVRDELREKLGEVGGKELGVLRQLCTENGFRLISSLGTAQVTTKEELNSLGIPPDELNGMLTCFMESNLIEYKQFWKNGGGYMICGHAGIAAYMVLAAAFLLAKKKYTLSEFMPV